MDTTTSALRVASIGGNRCDMRKIVLIFQVGNTLSLCKIIIPKFWLLLWVQTTTISTTKQHFPTTKEYAF